MHLALTGAYRARWSAQVHDEWKRNLLINRPDLTREQLDRTSSLIKLLQQKLPETVKLLGGFEFLI